LIGNSPPPPPPPPPPPSPPQDFHVLRNFVTDNLHLVEKEAAHLTYGRITAYRYMCRFLGIGEPDPDIGGGEELYQKQLLQSQQKQSSLPQSQSQQGQEQQLMEEEEEEEEIKEEVIHG